jgi:transposase-like protein
MSKQILTREEKGQQLASIKGAVIFTLNNTYRVKSQTSKTFYYVTNTELGWRCTCPDHEFRGVRCKHIFAVEIRFALHREVEIRKIEPITNVSQCIYCKSESIVKDGLRHNKYGDIQKFNCKSCKRYFTINIGFEKMKHSPQGITTAMQLYFSGESLRNTSRSLKLIGVVVSHQTIYNWIEKYTELMQTYLEKITPSVSNAWRADELFVKIKGNQKYLYALMDDETRFWIAQQVAHTKNTADVSPLLRKGKEIAKIRPKTFITDGGHNFGTAYEKELYTVKGLRTKHIAHIRLQGDTNNNKMERMNGEVRDREKTMRGLKKMDTPILKGYQLFHNYIREHEALKGKTPAEKCGIIIEGENKWKTLIQNASK